MRIRRANSLKKVLVCFLSLDCGGFLTDAPEGLGDSWKLKPPRHALDVSPVVFFVARIQATFFAWNDDEIQQKPPEEETNQDQKTTVKDGPAKPNDEYG